jgi:cob(I)alamin adenosyltransferase
MLAGGRASVQRVGNKKMTISLHYYAASRSHHVIKEERVSRLTEMVTDYRRSINELKQFQRSMSLQVATSLIEEILSELKIIATPIFNSLTQLDVEYLAFRMQQMAILSEAMLAINQVKQNIDKVVVSTEITNVFDELKVALLEIGYDFHHITAAEQLNEKVEVLKQKTLKQHTEKMEDYRTEILRKKTALDDLLKRMRQLEHETGVSLKESLAAGKAALFVGGKVTMPMSEVVAMIAHYREYQERDSKNQSGLIMGFKWS